MRLLKTNPEIEKCLPPLDEGTYQGLKANIKEYGYDFAHPIIVWKGKDIIVDGHHRYKLCQELGIDPILYEHNFRSLDEAVLYALEHQDNRRSPTPVQKAIIGTKRLLLRERLEAQKRERAGTLAPTGAKVGKTSEVIAKEIGISARTVDRLKVVIEANEPRLEEMITKGKIAAEPASDFIKLEPSKQKRISVLLKGPDAVKIRVNELRKEIKQKAEAEKQRALEEAKRAKEESE